MNCVYSKALNGKANIFFLCVPLELSLYFGRNKFKVLFAFDQMSRKKVDVKQGSFEAFDATMIEQ